MSTSSAHVKWVLPVSNVIMAFLSIVNAVPGTPMGSRGPSDTTRGTGVSASSATPLARPGTKPIASTLLRPLTAAAMLGGAALLRRRFLRWGATTDEQHRILAGDDILPTPDLASTRAISITTTAADVWPWLAQIGQGRGGFYSYDWLENLIPGVDIHNADRIVPGWQHIAVGDEVRLAPEVPLIVVTAEPEHALVLRGNVPMGTIAPPYDFTWAFVLEPRSDGTTRLLIRERYEYTRPWAALIVQPVALLSCLMTRKMLRGITSRAERHAERATLGAAGTSSLPIADRDTLADQISAAR